MHARRGTVRFRVVLVAGPLALIVVSLPAWLYGDPTESTGRAGSESAEAQKEALAEFNDLIGEWRGVGQPRRGSARGAWRETAEWVWNFTGGAVSIRYDVEDGKLLATSSLTYDPQSEEFHLTAETPEGDVRQYAGRLEDDQLVLASQPDDDGNVHRITITRLNEKRTLVLFERREGGRRSFSRVAEVGYTRQGESLASREVSGPECIVTGGAGTIPVMHEGETYYVCCTGCRQAFEDDPQGVIAEYHARLAEQRSDTADE